MSKLRERIQRRRAALEGGTAREEAKADDLEPPSPASVVCPVMNPRSPHDLKIIVTFYLLGKSLDLPMPVTELFDSFQKDYFKQYQSKALIPIHLRRLCSLRNFRLALEEIGAPVAIVDDSVTDIDMDGVDNLCVLSSKPASASSLANTGDAFTPPPPPPKDVGIDMIINAPTVKDKVLQETSAELRQLLAEPSARQRLKASAFKNLGGPAVREFCRRGTRVQCAQMRRGGPCDKVHFRPVLFPHTDVSLGDCSYLDTCRHIESCRFVHYEIDIDGDMSVEGCGPIVVEGVQTSFDAATVDASASHELGTVGSGVEVDAQWINCDVRTFDFSIFRGTVSVIMADPPWGIHMDLPYGTLSDEEMKLLRLDLIQDEGLFFLWVTGRALELGRDCLAMWGYRQIDELVWVKTNQLQRVVRTGRTGHWLNHSKEHCLVGIKGEPNINKHLDTDVIVAEVRETSRKPDEVYRIIERLVPGPYKLELFGRQHNTKKNWITMGNQLEGVRLHNEQLEERYNLMLANRQQA
ncbi:MAG: uncharacterized protein KVP18_003324 [Porospora cf. gigantea A]|uniref:uncharacterized protein n=1 Tax=Porospora cf. gigantea A TaxID=2853593 RepID=UPI00355A862D|nr:MAG: hypothetical protein KVP18_003324 [Porospora cf. gigantea A]